MTDVNTANYVLQMTHQNLKVISWISHIKNKSFIMFCFEVDIIYNECGSVRVYVSMNVCRYMCVYVCLCVCNKKVRVRGGISLSEANTHTHTHTHIYIYI